MCLDCELMPWSAKAQELLRQQYAAVGAAARVGLARAVGALEAGGCARSRRRRLLERHDRASGPRRRASRRAYRHYCWPVDVLADLRLAPFHVLATEGAVHVDKDHVWHMETIARRLTASR